MKRYKGFLIENYHENEILFSGIWVNIISLVASVLIIFLFGFFYYKIWGSLHQAIMNIDLILLLILFIGSIFIHEMIHGITWSIFTEAKINVVTGWVSRFCYCDNVIEIKHYITGLIMPTIILGIIPTLTGMILGNFLIFVYGITMTVFGTCDFFIIWLLRKQSKNDLIKDINYKTGVVIYSPK